MNDGINFENFDKWLEWLRTCEAGEVEKMQGRIGRTAGLRGLELTQDLTPVKTNKLAGSLSVGAKDNYFKVNMGKTTQVVYGTNVEYAEFIEKGFSQESRKGKFVPGYWKGDTFYYDPEAKTGMVLTGKVIEGAHMFQKGLDALEGDMDKIYEFELRRLYALLNG